MVPKTSDPVQSLCDWIEAHQDDEWLAALPGKLRSLLAAERERCAKLCDSEAERFHTVSEKHRDADAKYESTLFLGSAGGSEVCAARIRNGTSR